MFVYYYTVCYVTCIFYAAVRKISLDVYAVVRQISMLFVDNNDSVFCILY